MKLFFNTKILILLLTVFVASCSSDENQNQQSADKSNQPISTKNQNVTPLTSPSPTITPSSSPKPSPSASVQPTVSPTPQSNNEVRYYKGRGIVTEINLEGSWVGLNHEKIEDFMEAMIMQFTVKDKSMLNNLNIGDKVDFTIEVKGSTEVISDIKKR